MSIDNTIMIQSYISYVILLKQTSHIDSFFDFEEDRYFVKFEDVLRGYLQEAIGKYIMVADVLRQASCGLTKHFNCDSSGVITAFLVKSNK